MVIHHVGDVDACAGELHRVVKPGGLVFIRNVFSGQQDGARLRVGYSATQGTDGRRFG